MIGFVPSGLDFLPNGTLLISPRMELSSSLLIGMQGIIVKSLGSSLNDLLSCSNMSSIKTIFTNITVSFSLTQGSPPLPDLDFGLCARVFSAVLLLLEPTINFSYCSAVSPSKSRDFRLPEPAIPFFPWSAVSLSPRSLFSPGQRS